MRAQPAAVETHLGPDARGVGVVGARRVKGRAEPHRERAPRHLEVVDRVVGRRLATRRPQVAARDRAGRAVLLREVGHRPHEHEQVVRAAGCAREHRLVDGAVVVQRLVAAALLQDEDRRSVEQRLGAEHRLAELVQERIGHQRDERLATSSRPTRPCADRHRRTSARAARPCRRGAAPPASRRSMSAGSARRSTMA